MVEGLGDLSCPSVPLSSRVVSPGILGNQMALLPVDAPSQGKRIQLLKVVPDSHIWHREDTRHRAASTPLP